MDHNVTNLNLKPHREKSILASWLSLWASQVAQWVKNSFAMQETCVWFGGWEDSLEEGMATHSHSILTWRIPTDRGAWQAPVHRVTKSWIRLSTHRIYLCVWVPDFFSWNRSLHILKCAKLLFSTSKPLGFFFISSVLIQWVLLLWSLLSFTSPPTLFILLFPLICYLKILKGYQLWTKLQIWCSMPGFK